MDILALVGRGLPSVLGGNEEGAAKMGKWG